MAAAPAPLTASERDALRESLTDWRIAETALTRTFTFADFRTAVAFYVRIAFEAEALNHHPEVEAVYDRVLVRLRTHDAGDRVTALDATLARRIDACASLFRP